MTAVWVIGAGGLLGRAVVNAAERRPDVRRVPIASLPWQESSAFDDAARLGVRRLVDERGADEQWAILWVAGAAVTSTPQCELDRELDQFGRFLEIVEQESDDASDGAVFYASSAGGIYSGSSQPPFDESSPVAPISPYGRFKLEAERALAAFTARSGVRSVAGRIANLYGPGQSLEKMQGLISHLARAQVSPAVVSIYVSLDTMRDYLFVTDGAEMVLDVVARSFEEPASFTIKNLASGRSVTIAELIGQLRVILKRPPTVLLGTSAAAALQAHDLRIRSTVWSDLDARDLTPLIVGMRATLDDVMRSVQASNQRSASNRIR
ncbi:NAD-dependent epimerase/dehydratase family protein [Agromyces aureus]|uniref:NAD-dependent epimerase/dehydratase domain-containing protein n=1 Tax=Agromyces aureus TaxID=453304 RepID=A0A191WHI1_9MICO|nr:NAD-dependent epimerase/dehydratase family protein [Agromyces aureus]ANJ27682.1 hypothetical protein ATC03_14155 [Agromyces aureus]